MPNFEKNPTKNAKYMVQLILDKGMDPNKLNEKYLNKEVAEKKYSSDIILPEIILETSPVSLACIKY